MIIIAKNCIFSILLVLAWLTSTVAQANDIDRQKVEEAGSLAMDILRNMERAQFFVSSPYSDARSVLRKVFHAKSLPFEIIDNGTKGFCEADNLLAVAQRIYFKNWKTDGQRVRTWKTEDRSAQKLTVCANALSKSLPHLAQILIHESFHFLSHPMTADDKHATAFELKAMVRAGYVPFANKYVYQFNMKDLYVVYLEWKDITSRGREPFVKELEILRMESDLGI